MEWRLADAKNRFSELVKRALAEGPQRVVRRDDAVVVLAEQDYEKLTGKKQMSVGDSLGASPRGSTIEFGAQALEAPRTRVRNGRTSTFGAIGLGGLLATALVVALSASNTYTLLPETVRPTTNTVWKTSPGLRQRRSSTMHGS